MSRIQRATIARIGSTTVEYVSQGSNVLVVTFPHYGSVGYEGYGFGEEVLIKFGVDLLIFRTGGNHWFQDLSFEDCEKLCENLDLDKYNLRCGYGSSMGGYAAIFFAGALRLDRVLAISPQYSIDPMSVEWEKRFKLDAPYQHWVHPPLSTVISKRAEFLVLYDPYDQDSHHAALIARSSNRVRIMPVAYGGHPVGGSLAEMGLLKPILAKVINPDSKNIAISRYEMRRRRVNSSSILWNIGSAAFMRKRPQVGESLWRHSLSLRLNAVRLRKLSVHLRDTNRSEEALEVALQAIEVDPRDRHARLNLSTILFSLARYQQGAELMRESICIEPMIEPFYRHLSTHLEQLGDSEKAIEVISLGLKKGVKSVEMYIRKISLLERVGRKAELIEVINEGLRVFPNSLPLMNRCKDFDCK